MALRETLLEALLYGLAGWPCRRAARGAHVAGQTSGTPSINLNALLEALLEGRPLQKTQKR